MYFAFIYKNILDIYVYKYADCLEHNQLLPDVEFDYNRDDLNQHPNFYDDPFNNAYVALQIRRIKILVSMMMRTYHSITKSII